MKSWWMAALVAAMSCGALAQVQPPAKGEARKEAARADDAAVRARVEARIGDVGRGALDLAHGPGVERRGGAVRRKMDLHAPRPSWPGYFTRLWCTPTSVLKKLSSTATAIFLFQARRIPPL